MTSDFSIAVHALVYLGKNQDLISSDELAKHLHSSSTCKTCYDQIERSGPY